MNCAYTGRTTDGEHKSYKPPGLRAKSHATTRPIARQLSALAVHVLDVIHATSMCHRRREIIVMQRSSCSPERRYTCDNDPLAACTVITHVHQLKNLYFLPRCDRITQRDIAY